MVADILTPAHHLCFGFEKNSIGNVKKLTKKNKQTNKKRENQKCIKFDHENTTKIIEIRSVV